MQRIDAHVDSLAVGGWAFVSPVGVVTGDGAPEHANTSATTKQKEVLMRRRRSRPGT
jgi:hypothetical protein